MPIRVKSFDFADPLVIRQRRLPHWRQDGCAYFVTCHLGDSLPTSLLRFWSEIRSNWLRHHPLPWTKQDTAEYQEHFPKAMEKHLDAGRGSCALRRAECAQAVVNTLRHDDGTAYDLGTYAVMPTHLHLLVLPRPGIKLSDLIETWERVSAHHINRFLGRHGALWGEDAYDHIVRTKTELTRIDNYIRQNPVKAHLRTGEFSLGGSIGAWEFLRQKSR